MAKSKYAKYLIQEPKIVVPKGQVISEIKGRTWPMRIYMGEELIPGCPIFIEIGMIWEVPNPNAYNPSHSHTYDEVMVHAGTDPSNPEELGAELEFPMGDEKLIINKTSALFIPKGLPHAPVTWKRVDKPVVQLGIVLGGDYDKARRERS